MDGMKDRQDGFEKKFAHDEQLSFEVEARCCKIFGLWVADQLGISGADADTYAKEVVAANLDEPGFDDVMRKVHADYSAKGMDFDEHIIGAQLDKALAQAKTEVK